MFCAILGAEVCGNENSTSKISLKAKRLEANVVKTGEAAGGKTDSFKANAEQEVPSMRNIAETAGVVNPTIGEADKKHAQDLSGTAQTLHQAIHRLENMDLMGATLAPDYSIAQRAVSPLLFDALMTHLRNEWPELGDELDAGIKEKLEFVSLRCTFLGTCHICEGFNGAYAPMSTSEAVQAYLKSCRTKNLSPRSITHYDGVLSRLAGQYDWLPTEPEQIEEFLNQFSETTKADYLKTIRTFYKFLGRRELFSINPTDKIDRPRTKQKLFSSLSNDELIQLFSQPLSQRDRTIFILWGASGIRVGETIALNFEHIDGKFLKVPFEGKTGERLIPLQTQVRDALLALKDGCGAKDAIFRGRGGKRLQSEPAYLRLTQKAFRQAGLDMKKAHPHCLRHTFARLWITRGGDVESLRRILGHTNIGQTIHYVNLVSDDLVAKNEKHNPLLGLELSLPQA